MSSTHVSVVVNQSTIHTQFAAIQEDRDKLHKEVEDLDRSRRQEENALRELRTKHSSITTRIRSVSDTLGKVTHQRNALLSDKDRLRAIQIDEERQIKVMSEYIDQLAKTRRQATKAYVDELDQVNSNIQRDLSLMERKKIVLEEITSHKIKKMLDKKQLLSSVDSGKTGEQNTLNDWSEVKSATSEKFTILQESEIHWITVSERHNNLECQLENLKSQVIQMIGVNKQLLEKMETEWETSWHGQKGLELAPYIQDRYQYPAEGDRRNVMQSELCGDLVGKMNVECNEPVHMDLFYGQQFSNDENNTNKVLNKE